MSTPPAGKLPLPELAEMKRRGDKIVMVTAYDAPGARFAEDAGIDLILVGDTAAMVVLGHEGTTVPVTMDEMLFLTKTVARAAYRPIVVGDMPFGSYQVSDEDAVRNAIRFVKEARRRRRQARGRRPSVSRARAIVERRHPRDGPRRPHTAVRDDARRLQDAGQDEPRPPRKLVADALELEAAGCFALVLEAVPAAGRGGDHASARVPTIGIGAGADCDGQVLVYHDLLGLTEGHLPRFVKRYANLSREIRDALEAYAATSGAARSPRSSTRIDRRGGAGARSSGARPDSERSASCATNATGAAAMPSVASARPMSSRAPRGCRPRAARAPRRRTRRRPDEDRAAGVPSRRRPSGRGRRRRRRARSARRRAGTARAAHRRSRRGAARAGSSRARRARARRRTRARRRARR